MFTSLRYKFSKWAPLKIEHTPPTVDSKYVKHCCTKISFVYYPARVFSSHRTIHIITCNLSLRLSDIYSQRTIHVLCVCHLLHGFTAQDFS